MARADELYAELAVVELEQELLAAKEAGEVPRELKLRLRETRQAWRQARSGELDEGDAVASPATVETSASVQQEG